LTAKEKPKVERVGTETRKGFPSDFGMCGPEICSFQGQPEMQGYHAVSGYLSAAKKRTFPQCRIGRRFTPSKSFSIRRRRFSPWLAWFGSCFGDARMRRQHTSEQRIAVR